MPALKNISLGRTQVTGAGLVHLSGLPVLKNLDLRNTPITDASLAHLTGLPTLESLDLMDTQIADAVHRFDRKSVQGFGQSEVPIIDRLHEGYRNRSEPALRRAAHPGPSPARCERSPGVK